MNTSWFSKAAARRGREKVHEVQKLLSVNPDHGFTPEQEVIAVKLRYWYQVKMDAFQRLKDGNWTSADYPYIKAFMNGAGIKGNQKIQEVFDTRKRYVSDEAFANAHPDIYRIYAPMVEAQKRAQAAGRTTRSNAFSAVRDDTATPVQADMVSRQLAGVHEQAALRATPFEDIHEGVELDKFIHLYSTYEVMIRWLHNAIKTKGLVVDRSPNHSSYFDTIYSLRSVIDKTKKECDVNTSQCVFLLIHHLDYGEIGTCVKCHVPPWRNGPSGIYPLNDSGTRFGFTCDQDTAHTRNVSVYLPVNREDHRRATVIYWQEGGFFGTLEYPTAKNAWSQAEHDRLMDLKAKHFKSKNIAIVLNNEFHDGNQVRSEASVNRHYTL